MASEYFLTRLRQHLHVGLPVESAIEVLSLSPTQICFIPAVDPLLLGVVNWRRQLLWTLDLSDLIKIRPEVERSHQSSQLTTIVLQAQSSKQQIGCIVSELAGIVDLSSAHVRPLPSQIPESVRPYFSGFVKQSTPILLLDPAAVLQSPRWQMVP